MSPQSKLTQRFTKNDHIAKISAIGGMRVVSECVPQELINKKSNTTSESPNEISEKKDLIDGKSSGDGTGGGRDRIAVW